MANEFDTKVLDTAINATLQAIEDGKNQVFEIAESARKEETAMRDDAVAIQRQVAETIREVERLERAYTLARHRLVEVSRDFERYSEAEIKQAYDDAHKVQTQVLVIREREQQLRARRDDLDRRLRNLEQTIHRAESLITQLGVAFSYLSGDLLQISNVLKNVEQRRFLGIRVIQAQEEERKRVAREIHDGPAQTMANVVLRAEICEKMLDRDVNKVRTELQELKDSVRVSLAEVRQIIFDLRPMALDDLGLAPTLRRYLADFQDKHKVVTELKVLGREKRFNSSLEVAVFRSIQEALNNIWKHAKAQSATVRLELTEKQVNVHIEDNGIGFDVDEVSSGGAGGHFGLLGIKERIQLLEGKLEIKSNRGKGTKVILSLPISESHE
ncbi:sensor histidine kinase [Tumebacillus permanentifrigoris]|uniref:Signal transduction histidine-protein kinase/phosphatase DegS n=1 Tax=Tumebacillus permanentifrigoris TaxID=378543 RepID=A0A316DG47_9BACL|nr:sensor histidine kinase [Tumebacillus permanentifrigoris]PWK16209.1 two-component system sensor histidine kinase DegS [Tumebacillus permanentifrigoris]